MNCSLFSELTGMRCEPLRLRDGGAAIAVVTPFTSFDGDGIEVFASSTGPQVHFFDDGLTLHWLRSVGMRLGDDRRRWAPLRSAVQPYGVSIADDGTFETYVPAAQASVAFARMLSALLAVDAWAREHAGLPMDTQWLTEEAAMYLRAWKPTEPFLERPEPVLGLSGRLHSFQMMLAGEFIDAIGSHPGATGAELHKLVDLRALPRNQAMEIRVIVDDRRDAIGAAQETSILGNFARAWTMTGLIRASGAIAQPQ